MNKLEKLGVREDILKLYNEKFQDDYIGRVILENRGLYKISCESGEIFGEIRGKLKHEFVLKSQYPAVGDWVVLDRDNNDHGNAIIKEVLPRTATMTRKVAGKECDEQIIAANVDVIFICLSLNNDYNLNRLDRYMVTAWESGARPVVVLTKADLCEEVEEKISRVQDRALGIDVLVTSSVNNEGKDEIESYLKDNKTAVFVGSSGVGKSSLLNMISGEYKQAVSGLRNDDKGRHTTTYREMFLLDNGGIIIDTPGMRELQINSSEEVVDSTFKDVEELMSQCKFKNCNHKKDLGCAVKEAIKNGTLSKERYDSYIKMKKEARHIENKINYKAELEKKKNEKVALRRADEKHKNNVKAVVVEV